MLKVDLVVRFSFKLKGIYGTEITGEPGSNVEANAPELRVEDKGEVTAEGKEEPGTFVL